MYKKLIVGNWKMNPVTPAEAKKIFTAIAVKARQYRKVTTVICPPAVYIEALSKIKGVSLGAQNLFWESEGAYTGEISARMLARLGVKYAIIGHSERRAMGETSGIINKKIKGALKAGLKPILCIGESLRDERGEYHNLVKEQIVQSLAGVKKADFKNIVIAYEPVWAIGKSAPRPATQEESLEMSIFIKKVISDMFGAGVAENLSLIYGASVSPKNTADFLKYGGVGGLLPGRASLDPKEFGLILESADRA